MTPVAVVWTSMPAQAVLLAVPGYVPCCRMLVAAIDQYGMEHGAPWCDKGAASGKMWVGMQALGMIKFVAKIRPRTECNYKHAAAYRACRKITKWQLKHSSLIQWIAHASSYVIDGKDFKCCQSQPLKSQGRWPAKATTAATR